MTPATRFECLDSPLRAPYFCTRTILGHQLMVRPMGRRTCKVLGPTSSKPPCLGGQRHSALDCSTQRTPIKGVSQESTGLTYEALSFSYGATKKHHLGWCFLLFSVSLLLSSRGGLGRVLFVRRDAPSQTQT